MEFYHGSDNGNEATGIDSSASAQSKTVDTELQRILQIEQQRAQFHAQVHKLNDICWEVCMDRPGNRLEAKQEICFSNCVNRFIDVTLALTNRFGQLLQKSGGM